MLLCHFFHSQFLGGRKKSLDTVPLFLFTTDAYLFKAFEFLISPSIILYFLLNCLAPYGHLQILLHQLSHSFYCSSSWALILTWASIFCLILLSFWIILFTLATTCLPITPTSTFPSLLRSRHIFLAISYTLRMYASHTGIWSSCPNQSSSFFFFFFTLTYYSFCLSYETLSWSIEWSKPSFWNNTRIFLFPHLTQNTHQVQIILTLS